jgi:hypothetical protein
MLSAGILSITIESPQAHRTILVAPLCAFVIAWFLRDLSRRLAFVWAGAWPRPIFGALLALLLAIPLFNVGELYAYWPNDPATWRSFSPEASTASKRALQSPADEEVLVSPLAHEYQFNGYEREFFMNFFLRQSGRGFQNLDGNKVLDAAAQGALLIWGDSDLEIDRALHQEFPQGHFEAAKDPVSPKNDYLALELRRAEVPHWKPGQGPAPLLYQP